MKAWLWLIVAPLGVALMFWSYRSRQHADHKGPWSTGRSILSTEAAAQKTTVAEVIPARSAITVHERVRRAVAFRHGRPGPGEGPRSERSIAGQADRGFARNGRHLRRRATIGVPARTRPQ